MVIDDVKTVLAEVLQLGNKIDRFDERTPLFGSVPEFDSMAVITVIAALEEKFGITIDDGDITAETFATVGSLSNYVEGRLHQR